MGPSPGSPDGRLRAPREGRAIAVDARYPHPPSHGACHRADRKPDPLARRRPLPDKGEVKRAHRMRHSPWRISMSRIAMIMLWRNWATAALAGCPRLGACAWHGGLNSPRAIAWKRRGVGERWRKPSSGSPLATGCGMIRFLYPGRHQLALGGPGGSSLSLADALRRRPRRHLHRLRCNLAVRNLASDVAG
jgi:hypothetical protein